MKKIKLTQNKYALVDDADYPYLNKWKWCANKNRNTWYAVRAEKLEDKTTLVLMHRVILNTPKGVKTDHEDGNGLNNQRHNIRVCTTAQNAMNSRKPSNNTSGYKGVTWNKKLKKFSARIQINGRSIHLGVFHSAKEASKAYDKKATELFGSFALINKVKGE
jgi:hypothetical protein